RGERGRHSGVHGGGLVQHERHGETAEPAAGRARAHPHALLQPECAEERLGAVVGGGRLDDDGLDGGGHAATLGTASRGRFSIPDRSSGGPPGGPHSTETILTTTTLASLSVMPSSGCWLAK